MTILNFLINQVFGVAAIFLALIAFLGLLLQKKGLADIMSGTIKTALGVVILQQGTTVLVSSLSPLASAMAALSPATTAAPTMEVGEFMGQYGFEIGFAMIFGFLLNLLVARFTRWKTVFLTGHMLYWFPFVFVATAVTAGLKGVPLLVVACLTTAIYYVVAPNLVRPYIKDVTGDNSFTLGHPSSIFVLIGGFLAGKFGDKSKSTENIEIPKNLGFLKEVSITGSLVIMLTYVVLTIIFSIVGVDYVKLYGLTPDNGLFKFIVTSGLTFGAGLTILLLGVRMMIAEIVPAFTGIQEKLIPNAIPAYDCPLLFPYAPNAVIIGFLTSMVTSVITIIICTYFHVFKYSVVPVVMTCFFECGTAAVVGNARGGFKGAIISSAVSGVVLVFLMGWSLPFVENTIAGWLISNAGQDFSLWSIIEGSVLRLITR